MNFLVAKVKKLVAFATVSVAISSPGLTQTWCILNYDIRLILFGQYVVSGLANQNPNYWNAIYPTHFKLLSDIKDLFRFQDHKT